MKRLIPAMLVAPLWLPVAIGIIALTSFAPGEIKMAPGEMAGMLVVFALVISYAAMLLVGLPTHRSLKVRGYRSARAYATAFFLTGLLAWALAHVLGFISLGLAFALSYLVETLVQRPYVPLSIATAWALVGTTFWAILRPDRTVRIA